MYDPVQENRVMPFGQLKGRGDVGRFVRLFTFLPLKNILGP